MPANFNVSVKPLSSLSGVVESVRIAFNGGERNVSIDRSEMIANGFKKLRHELLSDFKKSVTVFKDMGVFQEQQVKLRIHPRTEDKPIEEYVLLLV